jgi:S1-C subfamily serine protease
MEMNTEVVHDDQVGQVAPDTTRRDSDHRMLRFLASLALVLTVGLTGYFLGRADHGLANAVAKTGTTPSPFLNGGNVGNGNGGAFGNFGGYPSPSTAPSGNAPSSKSDAAAAKIAASVDPGLVDINTEISYGQSAAAGTGMIVSSDGLILTNNHVIDGATSISVRDVGTGKVYDATVVGYDVSSDVAVLQLKNASGLTTIATNTKALTKGESVVGIGNAGGVGGTPSYAPGSVLGVDKSITAGDNENPTGAETLTGMIETNADIQSGDSGGALVNSKGEVIGMDTAASSGNGSPQFDSVNSTTQGFAIPIETALNIATSIEHGLSSATVHIGTTAFLGIEVGGTSVSPYGGNGNVSPSTSNGVTVAGTIANGPAANSGLTAGDVIVSINGTSVTTLTSVESILQSLKPGDTIHVGYTNVNGAPATLNLQLGSGPPQ